MRALTLSDFSAQAGQDIDRRIAHNTSRRLAYYAKHPQSIDDRLEQIDREWSVGRALETLSASLAFVGLALGATVHKRYLAIPALASGFMLQNAAFGWAPPVPILRNLGFRTDQEITFERTALRALRGDFGELKALHAVKAQEAQKAVSAEAKKEDHAPPPKKSDAPAKAAPPAQAKSRDEPKKAVQAAAKAEQTKQAPPAQPKAQDEPRRVVVEVEAAAQTEMKIQQPEAGSAKTPQAKASPVLAKVKVDDAPHGAAKIETSKPNEGQGADAKPKAKKSGEAARSSSGGQEKAEKAASKTRKPKSSSKKGKAAANGNGADQSRNSSLR